MNTAIFVQFLHICFIVCVSAQWVIYQNADRGNLPEFMDGADEELIEEFARITAERDLSADEYNQRMNELISQLNPSNQKKYMQVEEETRSSAQKVSAKFLELIDHLPDETKLIAQQLIDNVMASGQQTPDEMDKKMDEILASLSPNMINELRNAYFKAIQLVNNDQ